MIPPADPLDTIIAEINRVLSWIPWLQRPGVVVWPYANTLTYHWSETRQFSYINIPANWTHNVTTLRHLTDHEMGHEWLQLMGYRCPDVNPFVLLSVDPDHPERHEIVAEIFSRALGNPPLEIYLSLQYLSVPTPARIEAIEYSGQLPNRDAEKVALGATIGNFWANAPIPQWFRDWATNYQLWLTYYILDLLRRLR